MKKEDMVIKVDFFNALKSILNEKEDNEVIAKKGESLITVKLLKGFIVNEMILLAKKTTHKSNKPTKTQEENEILKTEILKLLGSAEKALSIKEMTSTETPLKGLSSSKMSALLTQLRNNGAVIREYDKKTAIFKLA